MRIICFVFLFVVSLAITQSAQADLAIVLRAANDGGVQMDIDGSGTYLDGGVEGNLFLANCGDFLDFAIGGNDLFADSISGEWLHNGSPVDIDFLLVDKDLPNVGGDDLQINYSNGPLLNGTYDFDLTATWDVATLQFSDLTPGVYSPVGTGDANDFNSIAITVVPEPSSALVVGTTFFSLGLAVRQRRRRTA